MVKLLVKNINNDVISEYLKDKNPHLKLSIKKLSKLLNITISETYKIAMNSKNLRFVYPHEIGTTKKVVTVVSYCENNTNRKYKHENETENTNIQDYLIELKKLK